MKKRPPLRLNEWEVLRIGADFKLRCLGCGALLWGEIKFEKNVKEIKETQRNKQDIADILR